MDQRQQQIEAVMERFAPELREAARKIAAYVSITDLPERRAFDVIASVLAFHHDAQTLAFLPSVPVSPQDDVMATQLDEWMAPWAAAVRAELFGSPEPPCAGLEEAVQRIRSEYDHPEHDESEIDELQTEFFGLVLAYQKGIDALQKRGLWTHGSAPFVIRDPSPDLHFIDTDGRVIRLGVERNELLSRLALAAKEISGVSGLGEAQTVAYILTGHRQYIPHVSVLTHKALHMPQYGQPRPLVRTEVVIVIRASDFSYEELRALWTQLRRRGVTEKKPLSAKHVRVWHFVRARRETMTMAAICAEWNAENPREHYSERGFWKAFSRAEEKGGVTATPREARTDTV
jgi:hypothetical protein